LVRNNLLQVVQAPLFIEKYQSFFIIRFIYTSIICFWRGLRFVSFTHGNRIKMIR